MVGMGRQPQGAFESLIESHLDGLYGVAYRYARDRSQAEDLVQDTVMRALRFRDHFEPGTNFKAWIYTILTNTFLHRYRRQKREREVLEGAHRQDVEHHLSSDEARELVRDPEHAYLDHLLGDDVLGALDALPEDFRTVVVLCDIEGLSYKDIAAVVGCPVGTVMSRLYRGRRLLETKLAGVALDRGILKRPEATAAMTDAPAVTDLQAFRRRKSG